MTDSRTFAAILLLSAGLAGPALAQSPHDHGGMSGGMSGHGTGAAKPDSNDDAATRDFKAADRAMMTDMDVPYTGDPDVDFRTHMIPHHRGAVAMAKVALAHARDPETRAMAQTIIDDQETEIAAMAAWLKRRGR
ncbi:DUF305 domain-containing protein [Methylobacterium sp. 17Sr1-1]|uniref:CopM family metallochaperone n=1 Tax=Methylobacterium sp. 17Sr1-1 TaxID=2202826 RepID=UPI000D702565|nr:DUF305 domain-containing protein [Methylobacterium sp. 17Sr1-1]AWN52923.1 DUF305 domain-containing protein [Methylobacterium sp. 17Sr1-1]